MYTYSAYQLNIHSEIPLRALTLAEGSPDILLVLASLKDLDGLKSNGGGHFVGEVEGVATFAVLDGHKIMVAPLPGVDDGLLNTFIVGPILAVVLRQRGLLVLHASSVVVDEGAIAFIGPSGAGKSTTAQAFHCQGYEVLTDDVMVVQLASEQPLVLPGYPLIKLWPESALATGLTPDELPHIHSQSTKRSLQLSSGFGQQSFPLKRIYLLDKGDRHRILPLDPSEACLALLCHSRATMLLTHPEFRIKNFRQCSWVAQNISMARFERKPNLSDLPELVQIVEADLGRTTASV